MTYYFYSYNGYNTHRELISYGSGTMEFVEPINKETLFKDAVKIVLEEAKGYNMNVTQIQLVALNEV